MDAKDFKNHWNNGQINGLTQFCLTETELIDLMDKYAAYCISVKYFNILND